MARRPTGADGPVYFTTFQVARMLGVSPPTVVNWVRGDRLIAHRTPGGHRRITGDDIVAFARAHDYPVPPELVPDFAPVPQRRVLIVDDEPDFCAMVRDYLTLRGGYEVESAISGFGAGLLVARFRPAVVLMDIMMPDMDGFEVLHMLQADPQTCRIPVVACTAYRDPVVEDRVRREAFSGYVQKPLKLDLLMGVLQQAIDAAAHTGG